MAETILQKKLQQDHDSQLAAREKVANQQALRPKQEELDVSDRIIRAISKQYARRISVEGITDGLKEEITRQVKNEVKALTTTYEESSRMEKLILDTMFGLGPLEIFMAPGSTVTDIIVHRYNHICIKDETGTHVVPAEFNSEEHLRNVISRIVQRVGRQINLANPAVDAKLDDGSRIHATIPPVTPDGATLTIRRFNTRKLDGEDYVKLGTMTQEMLDFLIFCVKHKISIIVSGGTDSGKTTLLNMLSSYIPEEELVITIEDNCELQLKHPNVRRMEARQAVSESAAITIQDLVRHSLRMCPDRIVVGEVRDGSVVDMLSAMSVGHEGSMSTVHTDSPRALFDSRFPTLFSMYSTDFSRETQSLMESDAIQLVVQIALESNGRRRVTHITATDGLDENTFRVNLVDLFRFDRKQQVFRWTGNYPDALMHRFEEKGINLNEVKRMLHLNEGEGV